MQLSVITAAQLQPRPNPPLKSIFRPCFNPSNGGKHTLLSLPCRCSVSERVENQALVSSRDSSTSGRRCLLGSFVIASSVILNMYDVAGAVSTSRRALRGAKVPESEFTTLPNGLKYYDLKIGSGLKAVKGSRVAVHYVAKWKGITFMTSRQGLGVGGGTVAFILKFQTTSTLWF